jgi:lupus La protein
VFVEFENEDAAKQFLEMEEKPKFNDKELLVKSKREYVDEKVTAIHDGTVQPRSPRQWGNNRGSRDGRGRGGGGRGRGDRRDRRSSPDYGGKRKRDGDDDAEGGDPDNWRQRRDKFQKGADGEKKETDAEAKTESKDAEAETAPAAAKEEAAAAPAEAPAATESEKKAEETTA